MATHPIELHDVWKQYRLGAQHDSLRDTIPALIKRLVGRHGRGEDELFWALRGVSFHVAQGETLGIIGPNGAGKSTILKLLSRIIRQTKGTVHVRGRVAALIELGGGFHGDLSGAENIALQGTMVGLSRQEIRRLFDAIVQFSGLEQFIHTPVKRYSSGMEARLGFAIAAHAHPDILLIDEVLSVGDLAFQQKCFKRIAELKRLSTTMIFISHNLEAVQQLCDRVRILQQGRVLCDGAPADMIRRYREEVRANVLKHAGQFHGAADTLQIRSVTLRGAGGTELHALETGQPLQVEISFETKRLIRHPVFQVSIERVDGLLCHTATSRQTALDRDELTGQGTVTLDYLALNLLPNLYQVAVKVFEADNPVPVAAVEDGCFFQIASDHYEQGAVHLDHTWDLKAHAHS